MSKSKEKNTNKQKDGRPATKPLNMTNEPKKVAILTLIFAGMSCMFFEQLFVCTFAHYAWEGNTVTGTTASLQLYMSLLATNCRKRLRLRLLVVRHVTGMVRIT